MKRNLAIAALALLAAGCASPSPPASLYRLSALPPQAGSAEPLRIMVERPEAPASLDTQRMALARCNLDFDYFAGVEWIDAAPSMIQRLLIESLDGMDGVIAVDASSMSAAIDRSLKTDLRAFQAEYAAKDQLPAAHVQVNAKIISPKTLEIVASRTFDARIPASANSQRAIVEAFDAALGQVMAQIRSFALSPE